MIASIQQSDIDQKFAKLTTKLTVSYTRNLTLFILSISLSIIHTFYFVFIKWTLKRPAPRSKPTVRSATLNRAISNCSLYMACTSRQLKETTILKNQDFWRCDSRPSGQPGTAEKECPKNKLVSNMLLRLRSYLWGSSDLDEFVNKNWLEYYAGCQEHTSILSPWSLFKNTDSLRFIYTDHHSPIVLIDIFGLILPLTSNMSVFCVWLGMNIAPDGTLDGTSLSLFWVYWINSRVASGS